MPRKTSQAVKKDTAVDAKNEGGAPRRSGRAVSKQESSSSKAANRSRRSSTAAQTAASVADSRSPKGRSTSSRRESTSPEGRGKTGRESAESPATRVKSTRRTSGRINYKESDGEEEAAPPPKYDENFESAEDIEESDSENEKSKLKGRSKPTKTPARGRATDKSKGAAVRGRRGRPIKKKSNDDEEDSETFDVSDDSADHENVQSNKRNKTPAKEKEPPKSGRSRRQKPEVSEVKNKEAPKSATEDKAKPSRRSARATSSKEESPKKRPSRAVQAKRYTEEEEEDEDIEEITDSKADEDDDIKVESEGSRKRKRGSTTEPSKRLKEDETEQTETDVVKKKDDAGEKDEVDEPKSDAEDEKDDDKDLPEEEPMEVDESKSTPVSENDSKATPAKEEKPEKEVEEVPMSKEEPSTEKVEEKELFPPEKEKLNISKKQESIDSSENLDESMHSSDSEHESRAEHSLSSGLEDSQDAKETLKAGKDVSGHKSPLEANVKQPEPEPDPASQSSDSFQQLDDNSEESKPDPPSADNVDQKSEKSPEKCESNVNFKSSESFKNDISAAQDSKISSAESPVAPATTPTTINISSESSISQTAVHSREQNEDASVNGSEISEIVQSPSQVIHNTESAISEKTVVEDSAPKANGAHDDLHSNSTPPNDQYYLLPGRKYVVNSKLSENARQSFKNQTFGFVSYNLGTSNSEAVLQKEKLLNELNKLDAHIICLQQVAKPFYSAVLEPSLDALGFKGTFSQPEESLKGMATFYKSSLFRLSNRSEASLKYLIEKELEASSLDANDKTAVKSHIKKCGNVLFTQFTSVIGTHTVTVANVQIPPTEISTHALQASCLAREVVKVNGGTTKPLLLGGEFNMTESEAPYQLLKDGYLSNDMIEELQRRKDVVLPGKENASLVNLLWQSFQHPSSNLCSCYTSVLDHELFIPELKTSSPDLLWYISDSLHTVGILDTDKPGDRHVSLKADIAFST